MTVKQQQKDTLSILNVACVGMPAKLCFPRNWIQSELNRIKLFYAFPTTKTWNFRAVLSCRNKFQVDGSNYCQQELSRVQQQNTCMGMSSVILKVITMKKSDKQQQQMNIMWNEDPFKLNIMRKFSYEHLPFFLYGLFPPTVLSRARAQLDRQSASQSDNVFISSTFKEKGMLCIYRNLCVSKIQKFRNIFPHFRSLRMSFCAGVHKNQFDPFFLKHYHFQQLCHHHHHQHEDLLGMGL